MRYANATYFLFYGPFGDQLLSQNVLYQSSPNFQVWYTCGWVSIINPTFFLGHLRCIAMVADFAQISENWHPPQSVRWHSTAVGRIVKQDTRINSSDDPSTSGKNLVNFVQ